MCQQVIFQAQVGTQNKEGVFVFAKKMDYQGMHEQECDVEWQVTGLKGIGGQAVLPFLETPGTKVQIMMHHVCWWHVSAGLGTHW